MSQTRSLYRFNRTLMAKNSFSRRIRYVLLRRTLKSSKRRPQFRLQRRLTFNLRQSCVPLWINVKATHNKLIRKKREKTFCLQREKTTCVQASANSSKFLSNVEIQNTRTTLKSWNPENQVTTSPVSLKVPRSNSTTINSTIVCVIFKPSKSQNSTTSKRRLKIPKKLTTLQSQGTFVPDVIWKSWDRKFPGTKIVRRRKIVATKHNGRSWMEAHQSSSGTKDHGGAVIGRWPFKESR